MKRQITFASVLVITFSTLINAQAPQTPKPGPEHARLGVLVGSWSFDGEFKAGNGYGAPAGKVSVVERFQWLPGDLFLQMNRDGKAGAGQVVRHMWIYGYDTVAKKYTGQFFELTNGRSGSGTATINGNTWTWANSGQAADGKALQERCTVAVVPNTSYSVRCETSVDGKTWSPSFEGKATKSSP